VGALAGLVTGGILAITAVVVTIVGDTSGGWTGALLAQPAAWAVPITFVVMIAVSLAFRKRIPIGVGRVMTRLHAPESLVAELRNGPRSSH
jgi:cation/acetate symporter